MKVFCVSVAILLVCQSTALVLFREKPNQKVVHSFQQKIEYIDPQNKVGADLCPTCISFTGEAINELLDLILQGGVVGTCGALCNALAQKTGSQILGAVCDVLCDYVGFKEFVDLVEKADLDPIYFCELLRICPIFDNGDAKITTLAVTPKSGPQGQFSIDFTYQSKNGTGTGEIILEIETVDGIPVDGAFLHEKADAGTYLQTIKLKAEPNPECNPERKPCEMWLPGNYSAKIIICNGECGSSHPHSKRYDGATTTFQITGKK